MTDNNSPVNEVEETSGKSNNFVAKIIQDDLDSGRVTKVVTRFPPEPNGYLHVGHAKSICLNFGLAEQFQGECNLRFDDTNPEKESQEFINAIKEDVQWLGFQWAGDIRYSSDYFDTLYDYAVALIKDGKAYVCNLTPEQADEYKGDFNRPGKTVRIVIDRWKRTWLSLKRCAPVNMAMVRRCCVPKSTCNHRT